MFCLYSQLISRDIWFKNNVSKNLFLNPDKELCFEYSVYTVSMKIWRWISHNFCTIITRNIWCVNANFKFFGHDLFFCKNSIKNCFQNSSGIKRKTRWNTPHRPAGGAIQALPKWTKPLACLYIRNLFSISDCVIRLDEFWQGRGVVDGTPPIPFPNLTRVPFAQDTGFVLHISTEKQVLFVTKGTRRK